MASGTEKALRACHTEALTRNTQARRSRADPAMMAGAMTISDPPTIDDRLARQQICVDVAHGASFATIIGTLAGVLK
jgi:hypothetical protein